MRELNKLGAEGWEVVGYGVSATTLGGTVLGGESWTLKRPLAISEKPVFEEE